jgi:hypothetical protein
MFSHTSLSASLLLCKGVTLIPPCPPIIFVIRSVNVVFFFSFQHYWSTVMCTSFTTRSTNSPEIYECDFEVYPWSQAQIKPNTCLWKHNQLYIGHIFLGHLEKFLMKVAWTSSSEICLPHAFMLSNLISIGICKRTRFYLQTEILVFTTPSPNRIISEVIHV